MAAFPTLPVLERLKAALGHSESRLRRTSLVCLQHLLETTGSLFEALIASGLPAQHIHVMGKTYSTNPQVVDALIDLGVQFHPGSDWFPWGGYDECLDADVATMWRSVAETISRSSFDRIVVLDDGGHATAATPVEVRRQVPVVAVEQTMSGLHSVDGSAHSIPVIAVASSAVKQLIEPPMIMEAAFQRAFHGSSEFDGSAMGVVGAGSIGRAIERGLLERGNSVSIYDPQSNRLGDPRSLRRATGHELLEASDVLWGCSGRDFFADLEPGCAAGRKTLISCSSSDREFRTALRDLNKLPEFNRCDRLSTVEFSRGGSLLQVRRGGFPVNFDGTVQSVPANDIQLTRGLLYAAVLQASLDDALPASIVMLSPLSQRIAVEAWRESRSSADGRWAMASLDRFRDEEWIAAHSGGQPMTVTSSR